MEYFIPIKLSKFSSIRAENADQNNSKYGHFLRSVNGKQLKLWCELFITVLLNEQKVSKKKKKDLMLLL